MCAEVVSHNHRSHVEKVVFFVYIQHDTNGSPFAVSFFQKHHLRSVFSRENVDCGDKWKVNRAFCFTLG